MEVLASTFERFDVGVRHALEPIVELDFAGHGDSHAAFQLVAEPRLTKRRDDERAGCVDDRHLGKREAGLGALDLDLVHLRLDRAVFPDARLGDGLHVRHVDVAARIVRHEVAHGRNVELAKRLGSLGADHAHRRDRRVECERRRQSIDGSVVARICHAVTLPGNTSNKTIPLTRSILRPIGAMR